MLQRIRGKANHLAGPRRDDRASEHPPPRMVDPHEPVAFLIHDSAIDLVERDGDRLDLVPVAPGRIRQPTDVRNFGVGVGAPGDHQRARAGAAEKERVLNHDARRRIGRMGELERRADVAGREDARVRCPQAVVDGHTVLAGGDAGRCQIEAFDVRESGPRR